MALSNEKLFGSTSGTMPGLLNTVEGSTTSLRSRNANNGIVCCIHYNVSAQSLWSHEWHNAKRYDYTNGCHLDVTHLCPSSVKAKSPSSRSRKRYLGGSAILLLSRSSDDGAKTSSTGAPSFVTDVFAAMYPSFRRVWRELTIRDNTFTALSANTRKLRLDSQSRKWSKAQVVQFLFTMLVTRQQNFLLNFHNEQSLTAWKQTARSLSLSLSFVTNVGSLPRKIGKLSLMNFISFSSAANVFLMALSIRHSASLS